MDKLLLAVNARVSEETEDKGKHIVTLPLFPRNSEKEKINSNKCANCLKLIQSRSEEFGCLNGSCNSVHCVDCAEGQRPSAREEGNEIECMRCMDAE